MKLTDKQKKDISSKILECFPEKIKLIDYLIILETLIATVIVDVLGECALPDKDLTEPTCDRIRRMVRFLRKMRLTQQATNPTQTPDTHQANHK